MFSEPPTKWQNIQSAIVLFMATCLTHWGRVTHRCVSKLIIIGSDNWLSPGRHQAIIWTNAGILLIWTLGTNVSEIFSKVYIFSFKKMHLKMSSAKWRLFHLGLNELRWWNNICDQLTIPETPILVPPHHCQVIETHLTPKRLSHFFKNVILFCNVVHHKCDIFTWNWSNTMHV